MNDMQDFLLGHWIEIAGTLTGLAYLYLELKANIWMWVAGIIMPVISLYVYWQAGLYADFGINIYYTLAAIYGFAAWAAGKATKGQSTIARTPRGKYPLLLATAALSFAELSYVLVRFTDSTVPYWDSFTTAMSIVGMWMLARKWIEQWIAWIVVDAVSAGLYIYKGIVFYAALYALYTIIAIYGYKKWKTMIA